MDAVERLQQSPNPKLWVNSGTAKTTLDYAKWIQIRTTGAPDLPKRPSSGKVFTIFAMLSLGQGSSKANKLGGLPSS